MKVTSQKSYLHFLNRHGDQLVQYQGHLLSFILISMATKPEIGNCLFGPNGK
ncbi:hypothetical protein DPMN_000868 [Dreissena polymorpha]|uniref:Uncharacterized protein n=1 Tax=Dreissena polymorpha TaxID=45954 RepID=A0A9D4MJV2_DREPO|nr:hypothetical protein DPMN_000868 [Dreissena polymorpha]